MKMKKKMIQMKNLNPIKIFLLENNKNKLQNIKNKYNNKNMLKKQKSIK